MNYVFYVTNLNKHRKSNTPTATIKYFACNNSLGDGAL